MVENLVVSQEIYDHVRCYFRESSTLNKYIPLYICQKYNHDIVFRVLAYNPGKQNYTVWNSWNESTQSLNCGNYDLSLNAAMRVFLDASEIVETPCVINSVRMKEIAEVAVDRIVNYDPDLAKEILIDDLDSTNDELEYFGTSRAYLEDE